MIFKPAGERHSDQFTRDGGRCLLVEIPPKRLELFGSCGSLLQRPGQVRSTRLASLGWRMRQEFLTDDACSALAVEGLLLEIVAESARVSIQKETGREGEARTFNRHYHTSVGEYLRRLRLEAAARDLVDSEASIAEIAAGLGFFDQSHFTRLFKRWTGLTPMQARARY